MFLVKRECICCAATYHLLKEVFLFCAAFAYFDYSSTSTHPFDHDVLRFVLEKTICRCYASGHVIAGDSLTQGARTSTVSLSDPSVSAGRDDMVQSTTTPSPSERAISAGRDGMVQFTTTPSPSGREISAAHDELPQSTTTPSPSDRVVSSGHEDPVQSTTTPSPSDRPVSAGHEDLVQLTTTPSLLDCRPLLGSRDANDRFDDHEPGASPVSIGRPLNTIFCIRNDIGSLVVGLKQRRDHEPPRRRARARKPCQKDICFAKDLSADTIAQHTRSCSDHTLTPWHRRSEPTRGKRQTQQRRGSSIGYGRMGRSRNRQDEHELSTRRTTREHA